MVIIEQAITKQYWEPVEDYLQRRFDVSTPVGRTGVRLVIGGPLTRTYVIYDERPIAWLYLRRRKEWSAHEVHQLYVKSEHRGRGLATRLYKAAINTDGILLATGKSHTKFSQALWKKFISRKLFRIWAHDFRNLNQHSEVWYDEDELQCNLPVYERGPHDVRFVAQRLS